MNTRLSGLLSLALLLLACAHVPAQQAANAPAVDPATGIVHSQRLHSGLPLGGIGVGAFQSMTDGAFARITLPIEPRTTPETLPACFGAIWTRVQGKTAAYITALKSAYNLPTLPGLDYDGLFPQAHIRYPDAPLPLELSLLTYSPLVPFDLKNSSLPAAAFVYRLHNASPVPVEAAVALAWGDAAAPESQVTAVPAEHGFFGLRLSAATPVSLQRPRSIHDDSGSELTLMAYPPRRDAVVTRAAWNPAEARPAWWDSFAAEGQVADFSGGSTTPGAQSAGVIIVHLTVRPNATIDVPLAVAWTTRHRYAPSGEDLGHYYQISFPDSYAVARYLLDNWNVLYSLTEEWQKRLTGANLPAWMARRLVNSAAALSVGTLHTRDGRFVWLGESGAPDLPLISPPRESLPQREARLGAFGLVLALYPELAAQEIRHAGSRIALPSGLPSPEEAADYTLLLAQYALGTNDPAQLQHEYLHFRRAMAALLPPEPGAPKQSEPASAAVDSLRLTALSAGKRLAQLDSAQIFADAAKDGLLGNLAAALPRMQADHQLELACEQALSMGAARFTAQRWNGHYFQSFPENLCASDQLFGSWIANTLGATPPIAADRIAEALKTLRAQNDMQANFPLAPVWLTNAQGEVASTEGADCQLPGSLLSEGLLAIQQNQPEAGAALLQRLDTTRANSLREIWNTPLRFQADTGAMPPAAYGPAQALDWHLLAALEGFAYDPILDQVTLSPKIPGTWRTLSAPIFASTFWGHVEFKPLVNGALLTFRLDRFIAPPTLKPGRKSGLTRLLLRSLRVPGPPAGATAPPVVHASLGPNPLGVRTVADSSGDLIVQFATPLSLSAGDRLEVDIH